MTNSAPLLLRSIDDSPRSVRISLGNRKARHLSRKSRHPVGRRGRRRKGVAFDLRGGIAQRLLLALHTQRRNDHVVDGLRRADEPHVDRRLAADVDVLRLVAQEAERQLVAGARLDTVRAVAFGDGAHERAFHDHADARNGLSGIVPNDALHQRRGCRGGIFLLGGGDLPVHAGGLSADGSGSFGLLRLRGRLVRFLAFDQDLVLPEFIREVASGENLRQHVGNRSLLHGERHRSGLAHQFVVEEERVVGLRLDLFQDRGQRRPFDGKRYSRGLLPGFGGMGDACDCQEHRCQSARQPALQGHAATFGFVKIAHSFNV